MRYASLRGLALVGGFISFSAHAIPMAQSAVTSSWVNPLSRDFVAETYSIDMYFSPFNQMFSDLQTHSASVEYDMLDTLAQPPQAPPVSSPPAEPRPGNLALVPNILAASHSIPEPGVLALFLGGLGILGATLRLPRARIKGSDAENQARGAA